MKGYGPGILLSLSLVALVLGGRWLWNDASAAERQLLLWALLSGGAVTLLIVWLRPRR